MTIINVCVWFLYRFSTQKPILCAKGMYHFVSLMLLLDPLADVVTLRFEDCLEKKIIFGIA